MKSGGSTEINNTITDQIAEDTARFGDPSKCQNELSFKCSNFEAKKR